MMERFEVSKRGRPKKYNEPVVRKSFDFPVSFVDKLTAFSEERRQSLTEVVMVALENEIKKSPSESSSKQVSPKLRTVPAAKSADIKAAVLEALKEHHAPDAGSHVIELSPELNKKLKKVSESIGFNEPAGFVEEVLRTLLRDPEEMRELILGKAIIDMEKALGIAPKLSEETPKRSKKVA